MASRVYHGYQQDLSQLWSALPILPSTQRPDFQLIFKRLLSKSAYLRGSAPDPAGSLQWPGPRWVLTAPPDPQLEKVGLDHPVEKSFPRHWFILSSTLLILGATSTCLSFLVFVSLHCSSLVPCLFCPCPSPFVIAA